MVELRLRFDAFGSIASFSGVLGEKLRSPRYARTYLNRIAGCVFAALALRLAIAER